LYFYKKNPIKKNRFGVRAIKNRAIEDGVRAIKSRAIEESSSVFGVVVVTF